MKARSHASIVAASVAAIICSCSLASPASAQNSPAVEARSACESALRLEAEGRPNTTSRGPCRQALKLGATSEDLRNEVASSTQPGASLTLDELVTVSVLADAAVEKMPDTPWGYLAQCDIAGRLGSASLMAGCVAGLRRAASQGATADGAPTFVEVGVSLGVWALRALLAFGLLGTLGRALWQRHKEARQHLRGPILAAILLIVPSVLAGAARAQTLPKASKANLSDFHIDDADPEASVPSPDAQMSNPLQFGYYLQDLAAKAEKASKRGDHAASAHFYGALLKAAPTVVFGAREMCTELEAAGDTAKAIQACRTAITLTGSTVSDHVRFVQLVLATKGPLPAGEREELKLVIDHLNQQPNLGLAYLPRLLGCEVAVRYDDFSAAESCAAELAKQAPVDARVITLEWAVAVHNHDQSAALRLLSRAKGAGINAVGLARMEATTREMSRQWMQHLLLLAFAVALVGAGGWFTLRHLNNRRLAAV
jgi:hypothetical protein